MTDTFSKSRSYLLYILLLLIICFTVFGKTLNHSFVWDDGGYHLVQNPYLKNLSLQNLAHFWTNQYQGMYIPASYTCIMLISWISRTVTSAAFDPSIFHFFNILMHFLNSFLLFLLLKRLSKKDLPAFLGTLLFMLHPIQVEAVAMVTEFRGLFATFWGLLFLLNYDRLLRNDAYRSAHVVFCILLFTLSILSKPIAIVFFPIALLYSLLIVKTPLKIIRNLHICLFFISLISIYMTTSSQPGFVIQYHTPLFARFFVWMDAVNFYLLKILLPLGLSPSYARIPPLVLDFWYTYVAWVIPTGLFAILIIKRKRIPVVLFSFLVFIIGFLPVSGLVPFIFQNWSTVADRYLYIPMIGVAFLVTFFLTEFPKNIFKILFISLTIMCGILSSLVYVPVWESNLTLWSHCIQETPQEANAYYNRGNAYLRHKEYEKANRDFEKAIARDPSFRKALYKKGLLLLGHKKFDEAIKYFDTILFLDPEFAIAYIGKAVAYYYEKDYDKAWLEIENAQKRGIIVNEHFIKTLKKASGIIE